MVSLSYAIGVPEPLEVFLYTYCTGGGASPDQMEKNIRETWPLDPQGIMKHLDLLNPIYTATSAYGHFGRLDIEFPWEKRDPRSLFTREEGYYA